MPRERRQHRYGLLSRLIGLAALIALLAVAFSWWIAGFSFYLAAVATLALLGLCGPAVADAGGGLAEFLSALLELVFEAINLILEAIGGLFSW